MSRRSLSARVAPGIELHTITIKLAPFGQPTVEMAGKVVETRNRRAAAATSAVLTTMFLPPVGEAFIEEMREAFQGAHTAKEVSG